MQMGPGFVARAPTDLHSAGFGQDLLRVLGEPQPRGVPCLNGRWILLVIVWQYDRRRLPCLRRTSRADVNEDGNLPLVMLGEGEYEVIQARDRG